MTSNPEFWLFPWKSGARFAAVAKKHFHHPYPLFSLISKGFVTEQWFFDDFAVR